MIPANSIYSDWKVSRFSPYTFPDLFYMKVPNTTLNVLQLNSIIFDVYEIIRNILRIVIKRIAVSDNVYIPIPLQSNIAILVKSGWIQMRRGQHDRSQRRSNQ